MRARTPYKPTWAEIEWSYLRALEAESTLPATPLQHVCEVTAHQPEGGITDRIFCHRDDASRLADALWRRYWQKGYVIRIVLDCRPMSVKGEPTFNEWLFDRKLNLHCETEAA